MSSEEKLKTLNTRKSRLRASLTRNLTYVNEKLSSEMGEIKAKITITEDIYKNFLSLLDEYDEFGENDLESFIEKFEDDYTTIKSKLESKLDQIKSNSEYIFTDNNSRKKSDSCYSHCGNSCSSEIKIPKLSIKPFNGDIIEFAEFWSSFEVIHNSNMSKPNKFKHLKTLLVDPVDKLVKGMATTDDNYDIICGKLQKTYGDKKKLINILYNDLINLPKSNNWTANLRKTLDTIDTKIRMLDALKDKEPTDRNGILYSAISKKFPFEILMQADVSSDNQSLNVLREKIGEVISRRENLSFTNPSNENPSNINNKFRNRTHNTTEALVLSEYKNKSKKCFYCGESTHYSDECSKVKSQEERKKKLSGRCFICMSPDHTAQNCQVSKPCVYCKKRRSHHRSICNKLFEKAGTSGTSQPKTSSPTPTTESLLTKDQEGNLLAVTCDVGNVNFTEKTTVILDCGSRRSYVTNRLANALKLKPVSYKTLEMSRICSDNPMQIKSKVVELDVLINGEKVRITVNTIPKIINKIRKNDYKVDKRFEHLKSVNLDHEILPELLIGNDYMFNFLTMEKIEIDDNVSLVGSKFGWFTVGRIEKSKDTQILFTEIDHTEKLWKLDCIGIDESLEQNYEDDIAVKNFYDNINFIDNKYYVSWPWKEYPPDLKSNYGLALGCLKSQLKKFSKNKTLLVDYDKIIQNQKSKGIIEEVTKEMDQDAEFIHYLPHHEVITPGKSTSLRIVHNGSAKVCRNDKSLNECILRGRILLANLCGLLFRFQINEVGIIADVEKAFLQMGLNLKDRDCTRFLWLKDIEKPLSFENLIIYRFTSVMFGVIASPSLLGMVIYYHLQKYANVYDFIKFLLESIYVDNVIMSIENLAKAFELYKKTKEIFQEASMNLRNWQTNCIELREKIDPIDRDDNTTLSVLGLIWNSNDDTLQIKSKLNESSPTITKRIVIKIVSSIFDPLGYLSPVLLSAKLFIQHLWKLKIDWDDELSPDDQILWSNLLVMLKQVESFKINRYFGINVMNREVELHCFVDASSQAYAAVIYLKFGNICRILFAKARIAPSNNNTIPKLELLSIYIGCKVMSFVIEELRNVVVITKSVIWSDSKCALAWIKSRKILPRFVEKIVRKLDKSYTYRYVPSAENSADIATRGCEVSELPTSWLYAPCWLSKDESEWPKMDKSLMNEEEFELEPALLVDVNNIKPPFNINCNDFESLNKLLDATLSYKKNITPDNIVEQTTKVLSDWIKYVQEKNYSTIIQNIKSKSNRLTNLQSQLGLILDEEGILHCSGRLINSSLDQNAKQPILLPEKEYLTTLIIKKVHEENYHVGVQHTLSEIRRNYWILRGRSSVYRVIKNCRRCQFYDGGSYIYPPTPPLPPERVNESHPFSCCGIDTFGPLYVYDDTIEKKVFVCLFTCMVTRAIHLELLEDMSTSEFLLSFRNFISIRTVPKFIVSDNAPQFKLTKSIFELSYEKILSDPILTQFCINREIVWKLLPEYAPWQGGFYKRLISIIKSSLRKTIFTCKLSSKQLRTMLYETTSILNSRPIIYLAENDRNTLCPNDLLNTKLNLSPDITAGKNSTQEKLVALWKKSTAVLDEFWKRWKTQYLASLRDRNNCIKKRRNVVDIEPKVGDVVLVESEKYTPRGSWKTGKIVETYRSNDGYIRSCQVQITDSIKVNRPVNKLYPLETSNSK